MHKYTRKGVLVILFLACFKLQAAAPLFHAIIAEKWMAAFEQYNPEQKRAFMLGTLFPDIRYIAQIPRQNTHEKGITFQRVMDTQDPFLKGMRLHVFVDITREKFVEESKILTHLTDYGGDPVLFLKMFEDELLYLLRQKDGSESISYMLQHIEPAELTFGASLESVRYWHKLHAEYFKMRPSVLYAQAVASGNPFGGITANSIKQISHGFALYAEDVLLHNYVLNVLAEFDTLFNHGGPCRLK